MIRKVAIGWSIRRGFQNVLIIALRRLLEFRNENIGAGFVADIENQAPDKVRGETTEKKHHQDGKSLLLCKADIWSELRKSVVIETSEQ